MSTGVRNTKLKKGKLTEEEIALIRREHGITPEKLAQWEEETKRNRKKRRR